MELKTNRKKYFLDRDEYDTMKAIEKNLPPDMCVIEVISGEHPDPKHGLCWYGGWDDKCDKCYQKWLNEEGIT